MYSTTRINKNVANLERKFKTSLVEVPIGKADDWTQHLDSLIVNGELSRDLTKEESDYITNEIRMCSVNFRYWLERYCWFIDSERRLRQFRDLWVPQEMMLDLIAKREDAVWDEYEAGYPSHGIRIIYHKSRQQGATMISQAIVAHRCNFQKHVLALTASADDEKTQKVFDRCERIYDNLPWWMRGNVTERSKDHGMKWGKLDSEIMLQDGRQEHGVGMGETWEVIHCTECAAWRNPLTIEHDLMPAMARSPKCIAILESTAQGIGNWWHGFTEQVRNGDAREWDYLFVPWYAEPSRYTARAPENWRPSNNTVLHADKVRDTSSEWVGKSIQLTRDQLFWYETTREQYRKAGTLNIFLTNYCATPEESFQHSVSGAIPTELAETLRLKTQPGIPYEISSDYRKRFSTPDKELAPTYEVHKVGACGPLDPRELDKDPRGIFYIWENPSPYGTYVVAADPSYGIPGWTRYTRADSDKKTDNGSIHVVRAGLEGIPDRVVAAYAAPIDAEDLADPLAFIGRLYKGTEDTEALCIIEVQPGPGLLTQRKLIDKYGYTNLYQWKTLDSIAAKPTMSFGWYATNRSVRDLWAKGIAHISREDIQIPDIHTIEELAMAYFDPSRGRGEAPPGHHDDRIRSVMLATWALHDWGHPVVPEPNFEVTTNPNKNSNYQNSLMTYDELIEDWNDRFNSMLDE